MGWAGTVLGNQALWITAAVGVIIVFMSWLQPDAFGSAANFYNITRNFSFVGIMALGMTAVIITGGIDLSVGIDHGGGRDRRRQHHARRPRAPCRQSRAGSRRGRCSARSTACSWPMWACRHSW